MGSFHQAGLLSPHWTVIWEIGIVPYLTTRPLNMLFPGPRCHFPPTPISLPVWVVITQMLLSLSPAVNPWHFPELRNCIPVYSLACFVSWSPRPIP